MKGESVSNVTYSWTSSDKAAPTDTSTVSVSGTRADPGDSASTATCKITFSMVNAATGHPEPSIIASGSATVSIHMGVQWRPGAITGGVMTSPQNQAQRPATLAQVVV